MQDTFKNRSILIRGIWSNISRGTHLYEISYSDDGGKTWRAAFIAELTRLADAAPAPLRTNQRLDDGAHAFDVNMAKWSRRSVSAISRTVQCCALALSIAA
ncbi:MAG: hypothetical protein ABJE10_20180 [bacterium]